MARPTLRVALSWSRTAAAPPPGS